MPIPRIIHQTSKSPDIGEPYRPLRQKLLSLHPNWRYCFYDDGDCRQAIKSHFPALLPIYDSFAAGVQRADMFRVVALYVHGGFYLDLDVECLRPLDELCDYNCVLAEEKTLTLDEVRELGHQHPLRIANYMFASESHHLFLLHLLLDMVERSVAPVVTDEDILQHTGPGLMTDVYHACRQEMRDIVLLRNLDRVCPAGCGRISCHFGNYARHYHVGSWRGAKGLQPNGQSKSHQSPTKDDFVWAQKVIGDAIDNHGQDETLYLLQTYRGEACDGLSAVFERCVPIGVPIEDSKRLKNKKVLVAGVPFLYLDRISPFNTNVVYTTFESDQLPHFWVQAINNCYQYCIVPHESVKAVFQASGVKTPIDVIHQGYTRYKRQKRKFSPGDSFRVGFLGAPTRRKNLHKLHQACLSLQQQIRGIKLVVHAPILYDWLDKSEIDVVKTSHLVEWSEGAMAEGSLSNWFNSLSCYVYPSSGEGWSFTPRESLYLGLPTIISDIPVHEELIASGFYKVIPSNQMTDAQFEGNNFGRWRLIETEDIRRAIHDVYENYGIYQIKSLQGSLWVEKQWSNENMQQRLLTFLKGL